MDGFGFTDSEYFTEKSVLCARAALFVDTNIVRPADYSRNKSSLLDLKLSINKTRIWQSVAANESRACTVQRQEESNQLHSFITRFTLKL